MFKEDILNEAKILLQKLEAVSLLPHERQKVKSHMGSWFCQCDSKNLYYLGTLQFNFIKLF